LSPFLPALERLGDAAMTAPFRSLVAALAILATLLTAGAVGAARGQAMAAGEIVICANGAAVTIAVDAEGNPTGAPHWCPDCVLLLLAGLAPAHAAALPAAGAAAAAPPAMDRRPAAARPAAPLARGPPRA
jgi:hypothetical protein